MIDFAQRPIIAQNNLVQAIEWRGKAKLREIFMREFGSSAEWRDACSELHHANVHFEALKLGLSCYFEPNEIEQLIKKAASEAESNVVNH